jgi:SAM-dependent methyltransferase
MGSAQVQGELWGAAAETWAALQEPSGAPLYEATFDALGVGDGTQLLDVGCGAGLAVQLAAKRGATVSGFDASAGLLAVARDRMPGVNIRQGDLEELPYEDNSFDVVTAFNSVQYAADPLRALREIKRVATPSGIVAMASWGDPAKCEARVLLAALGSLLPPPPPGAGGPFALAAPGALEALLEQGRLTAERGFEVQTPFEYTDLDAAVRAAMSSGPAYAAIGEVGATAVEDAARAALTAFVQSDGSVRIDNVMRVVIAHA